MLGRMNVAEKTAHLTALKSHLPAHVRDVRFDSGADGEMWIYVMAHPGPNSEPQRYLCFVARSDDAVAAELAHHEDELASWRERAKVRGDEHAKLELSRMQAKIREGVERAEAEARAAAKAQASEFAEQEFQRLVALGTEVAAQPSGQQSAAQAVAAGPGRAARGRAAGSLGGQPPGKPVRMGAEVAMARRREAGAAAALAKQTAQEVEQRVAKLEQERDALAAQTAEAADGQAKGEKKAKKAEGEDLDKALKKARYALQKARYAQARSERALAAARKDEALAASKAKEEELIRSVKEAHAKLLQERFAEADARAKEAGRKRADFIAERPPGWLTERIAELKLHGGRLVVHASGASGQVRFVEPGDVPSVVNEHAEWMGFRAPVPGHAGGADAPRGGRPGG
jgi:hypothetical protein